ncbi:DUF2201 family putative metallopeptidase [Nonomuraea sp. SYSU D8015]|uniref:DUF2201 family putative metallopeptidase n=1 Tax=Nonomuraea sp. SYSU D8015 TaxID=2593644 RepID=UPI001CB71C4E|nr:hypothetical protein [Nonomuraea sp. SYSU D8015]
MSPTSASIAAVSAEAGEIYVNPLAQHSELEWRFVLAHEMLHAALRHGERCGMRDPYLWNVACASSPPCAGAGSATCSTTRRCPGTPSWPAGSTSTSSPRRSAAPTPAPRAGRRRVPGYRAPAGCAPRRSCARPRSGSFSTPRAPWT